MNVPDFVARLAYCLHRAFYGSLAYSVLLVDRFLAVQSVILRNLVDPCYDLDGRSPVSHC